MNLDTPSSASPGPSNQRKERGAIAAQACETCRSRKQKCDEQRPKCGLCHRMKLECRYREPQPTKKDKTLVEILDSLKRLEGKVDRISIGRAPVPMGFGPPPTPSSQPSIDTDIDDRKSSFASQRTSQQTSSSGRVQPYRHASASHKMLAWPAIQQILLQSLPPNIGDFSSFDQDGSAFIVRIHEGRPNLPVDGLLPNRPFVGMQSQASRTTGASRVIFPDLTQEMMHRLATAYFDTFNFLYPFMDRQNFISDTLTRVYSEGFDDDTDSVIALLVFALGQLAIECYEGLPINVHNSRPSGIRGGSVARPPGLALFNEARKRLGFVFTQCELENVQILSMAALYYESCSYHVDFWRLSVSASLACQVLVSCKPIDWNSPKGDLVRRVYWHCAIMETGLYLELDLPPTGIIDLEDRVGIPSFNQTFCDADHRGNQSSHFEAHYASQVALRRLCANLHQTINDSNLPSNTTPSPSTDTFNGPSPSSLRLLASQLAQWRGMLPPNLQWPEDDPTSFPSPQPPDSVGGFNNQPLDPNLPSHSGAPPGAKPLFTADLESPPIQYPYAYDIQIALLRTRFYYAKYMIYRPFVYKALHFPDQMTQDDAEGAAECLRCCTRWPLTLSPTSKRKRLIPYLFCWSQNFLGILIIFHMTRHNPMLRDIRTQLCGPKFETEVNQTVEMMLDWIRDLKSTDSFALWCWNILQGIYQLEP